MKDQFIKICHINKSLTILRDVFREVEHLSKNNDIREHISNHLFQQSSQCRKKIPMNKEIF